MSGLIMPSTESQQSCLRLPAPSRTVCFQLSAHDKRSLLNFLVGPSQRCGTDSSLINLWFLLYGSRCLAQSTNGVPNAATFFSWLDSVEAQLSIYDQFTCTTNASVNAPAHQSGEGTEKHLCVWIPDFTQPDRSPTGPVSSQSEEVAFLISSVWAAAHLVRTWAAETDSVARSDAGWLCEAVEQIANCEFGIKISENVCQQVRDGFSVQTLTSAATAPRTTASNDLELDALLGRVVRCQQLEQHFQRTLQQEKLAALKQLAYGASHEVNNPLGNIATRAQSLMREETDAERRRQLGMIVTQAYRAHDMIGDMMLFANPPTPEFELVSPWEIFKEILAELQSIVDQQQATITTTDSDECESIVLNADRNHLTSMLKAIIQNALDAIPRGGKICLRISIETNGPRALCLIQIEDSGPGLSDLARRHLFDPFFSGREAGRGLGFGLAKAWTITQLHGGSICAQDNSIGGLTVSVRLPLHPP
jgi:signal transduction histidine kinase